MSGAGVWLRNIALLQFTHPVLALKWNVGARSLVISCRG